MDIREIQNLIKFVAKSGATEVKLEMDDFKITIKTTAEGAESTTTYVQHMPMAAAPQVAAPQVVASPAIPAAPTISTRSETKPVNENSLGPLLTQAMPLARAVRADRYGIRTFLMVDDVPIKFEIVREDRIPLQAQTHPGIPILTLSQVDMFAEKLLANTDRWADRSTTSRDTSRPNATSLQYHIMRRYYSKCANAQSKFKAGTPQH
mgnify:CR=1 FL=1